MTRTILAIFTLVSALFISSYGFAEEQNLWEAEFVKALQEGKAKDLQPGEGLGYTPDEEQVLKDALEKALSQQAPPCETMKIAVDLQYQPYSVLKNIFSSNAEVDLNQMCMCATEKGVRTEIFTQAADDVNRLDEVTQAQCIGLGFTEALADIEVIDDPDDPPPFSTETPETPAEVPL